MRVPYCVKLSQMHRLKVLALVLNRTPVPIDALAPTLFLATFLTTPLPFHYPFWSSTATEFSPVAGITGKIVITT